VEQGLPLGGQVAAEAVGGRPGPDLLAHESHRMVQAPADLLGQLLGPA
jgi:hypothetical protein